MGIRFDALSKHEQFAVADHERGQYKATGSLQPETYASRNAKADPKRWQDELCELIASDQGRVDAIVKETPGKHQIDVSGFTLIELSIVLVIIGLIVGGVLVGQDLIRAAGERAQISQIEKYNTAVNVFREKYSALPGDMNTNTATQFGFSPLISPPGQIRNGSGYAGMGDGNGLIEGTSNGSSPNANCGYCVGAGEPVTFWSDLTYANGMKVNLIEGSFNVSNNCYWACGDVPNINGNPVSGSVLGLFFPPAKVGAGNWVYVYSSKSANYYGISQVSLIYYWELTSTPGLTVKQAYDIDQKIDDGLPQSGNVTATYISYPLAHGSTVWAAGGGVTGVSPGTTETGSSTTCYDDGGSTSNPMGYSIEISNGANVNCALSFKMQAGD